MGDEILKVGNSRLQHGENNNRVYIMQLDPVDTPQVIKTSHTLAREYGYAKLFGKVPNTVSEAFIENGFKVEASIPGYYSDADCLFVSKFITPERKKQSDANQRLITSVINTAKKKKMNRDIPPLPDQCKIKTLDSSQTSLLAGIFKKVFKTYPFPVHDPEYIAETMTSHITYFGCFFNDELAAVSSAEIDKKAMSAEMTDFAVKPEYRGNSLGLHLLSHMEKTLSVLNISTFFTIARSVSYGMNITFGKCGYKYGGTLVNNTNIAGSIESMNIWYKNRSLE